MDESSNFTLPPSTAARPDLDWSQARETIMMLKLAVAQIAMVLQESSGSVDVLTHSFTDRYGNLMAMEQATLNQLVSNKQDGDSPDVELF